MKHIISFIRRLFRVQYRLAVLYHGETSPRNTYGKNPRILRHRAHEAEPVAYYWSLYKSGPFGLPEREVDYSI